MVRVAGPGGFKLEFPLPRLPRLLGAPNLGANVSIYPQKVRLDAAIIPFAVTVAAGAVAASNIIGNALIPNWTTRFQSLFNEFCIVGALFEIRLTSTTAGQGAMLVYVDENPAAAAPTLAKALNSPHADVPLVATNVDSTGSIHRVQWLPKSYDDLTWDLTTTSGAAAVIQFFAAAGTGTAVGTAANCYVTGVLALEFRGYA